MHWADDIPRARGALDRLYAQLNRRRYVSPDPLEHLYAYPDPADRAIVGLLASSLAFGGVKTICRSIGLVLEGLEQQPSAFLAHTNRRTLRHRFKWFRHRWVNGDDLAEFLWAIRQTVHVHGSLESAAALGRTDTARDILANLVRAIRTCGETTCGPLLSDPAASSACKRLHLFLRWMVRTDAVDPGGWTVLRPADLWVPLDTHMYRMACAMHLTRRRTADGRTALEITEAFRRINPADPVRYDFALTRLGIRPDLNNHEILSHIFGQTTPDRRSWRPDQEQPPTGRNARGPRSPAKVSDQGHSCPCPQRKQGRATEQKAGRT